MRSGICIRIYAFAQREQASFHWVTIDESVDLPGSEVFDPVKMAELYEIGHKAALAGPVWSTNPRGCGRRRRRLDGRGRERRHPQSGGDAVIAGFPLAAKPKDSPS